MSIDVGIISEQTKANCKFIQGNNTLCQDDATNMLQPYTYHGYSITQSGYLVWMDFCAYTLQSTKYLPLS